MTMSLIASTFSMAGKSVLLSGASSGLGAHFARVLALSGCTKLVLSARRIQKLEALAATIRLEAPGCIVCTVPIDISNVDSISNGVHNAEEAVGAPMNVLINCAGVANPMLATEMTESDWDQLMSVNLKGNFFMATEFAKRLIHAKEPGTIVNIASILSIRPGSRQSNYAASKAAMLMFNKVHAVEWSRYGIRTNCLCPGYFSTEMNDAFFLSTAGKQYLERIPPKRLGNLNELNGPLLLLASDASSFMTGTEIIVDLGHTNAAL
jgi:NAD(P)-dependent dehydrogenase (short-subunit alcohol dehydrogenase family)